MAKYYVDHPTKNNPAKTLKEARKKAVKKLKSEKYEISAQGIYNSKGNPIESVERHYKNIDLVRYSKSSKKFYMTPLNNDGGLKKPNLEEPYFFRHNGKTFRFKTLDGARKSAYHVRIPSNYPYNIFELDIYKETKNGSYRLGRTTRRKYTGECYWTVFKKNLIEEYSADKSGRIKKIKEYRSD